MVRYLCIDRASYGNPGSESRRTAVRIPVALIRAGVKLDTLIPDTAIGLTEILTDHGMYQDLRDLTEQDIEHLVGAPDVLEIAIMRGGREKVRIYVE
ncbi:MAG TPA: hypothetical protein G4O18_10545 [Dehalococcoidia bacterium]|nr:hypothetical protein [Dehalococcoidia bacterium]